MSILLELNQELSELSGTHLKWSYNGLTEPIHELTLIYVKKNVDDSINSILLNPLSMEYSLNNLEPGVEYLFMLNVVDFNRTVLTSNSLSVENPLVLSAPVIASASGLDRALQIELEEDSNSLNENDKVEFIIRRDNTLFIISKAFDASGVYVLGVADDSRIDNNYTYKVALRFVPSDASQYRVPSSISSSVFVEPTNKPNIPQSILLSANHEPSPYSLILSWTRPNDFAEWSSNFNIQIHLKKTSEINYTLKTVLTADVLTYTISDLEQQSFEYMAKVIYVNRFGAGVPAISNAMINYGVPDAPSILAVSAGDGFADVTFTNNADNGRPILFVKVLANGVNKGTFFRSDYDRWNFTIRITGLTNGETYDFAMQSQNQAGWSSMSESSEIVIPAGAPSMTVSKSGKTLTIQYTPNGRALQQLTALALDGDVAITDEIIKSIDVSQNQSLTAVQTITVDFDCSSDIVNYLAVSSNGTDALTVKNF